MTGSFSFLKTLAILIVALTLNACATTGSADIDENNDPLEGWNRSVFAFNTALDKNVLKPIVSGYNAVTPEPVRDGLRNFSANLSQPFVFLNTLLQGKFDAAGDTFARFLINSTVGIAGLFDVATRMDIPRHREDFGQTLGVWGMEPGPYLVLPFLGPSNFRDTGGTIAGVFADPVTLTLNGVNEGDWNLVYVGTGAFQTTVRIRPTLDQLYNEKDPYAFARSAYRQARSFAVCDGRCPTDEDEDDLFDDLDYDEDEDPDGGSN